MSKAEKGNNKPNMTMIVEGHEVALIFADTPNPQVAAQIRQVLLGAYFPAKR